MSSLKRGTGVSLLPGEAAPALATQNDFPTALRRGGTDDGEQAALLRTSGFVQPTTGAVTKFRSRTGRGDCHRAVAPANAISMPQPTSGKPASVKGLSAETLPNRTLQQGVETAVLDVQRIG
jgi:hypothetical protein